MTLVDTNVVIDVLEQDPIWFEWSAARLTSASVDGAHVDSIVVAELSRHYGSYNELQAEFDALGIRPLPLDEASAFLGGKRYQAFRGSRAQDERTRVLPDFLIGAHALTLEMPLLTRDPRLYRRYFPELNLITPDTDNG